MKRTIFLDAGGVILNEETHEEIRADIITNVLKGQNPLYSTTRYWQDIQEAVFRFVPGVYNYVIWKNTQEKDLYFQIKQKYKTQWEKINPELVLMDHLEKVLDEISKEYTIGILGQYGRKLHTLLSDNTLIDYFTYANTQDEFAISKPNPRYFEQVLSKAGVKSENSIMVGDRIDKDIIPAKQIGMKTIRLKTGIHADQQPRTLEEFPDVEIDVLTDLPAAVKKIEM